MVRASPGAIGFFAAMKKTGSRQTTTEQRPVLQPLYLQIKHMLIQRVPPGKWRRAPGFSTA